MKQIETVSFIGSGNVATHLAQAFYEQNIEIRQICSPTLQHAETLAHSVGASAIQQIELLEAVDCVFIAIPDDAIDSALTQIPWPNQLVAHCSGVMGLEAPYDRLAFFYPLQSFKKSVPTNLKQTPIFVGARYAEDEEALFVLAERISDRVKKINVSQKAALHAAAVVVNNFVNYLFGLTNDYLQANHLDFEDLEPIIQSTVDKALQGNALELQTGPAVRNDKKTIALHQEQLQDQKELLAVYNCLTQSIQRKFSSND